MHMARPFVLVASPDFPPRHGGIQVLAHRVVAGWSRLEPRVLTLQAPGGTRFDREQGFVVRRIGSLGGDRRLWVAAMNAAVVADALRHRPAAIMSMHVVAAPGAAVAGRLLGIPFVQYVYANELVTRPRLASFAVRAAARTVVISEYTERLASAAGAAAERTIRILPGVDVGMSRATRPAVERENLIAVTARLDERYKGHDVLLRALPLVRARVPDARLAIIGDGRFRPTYEALARSAGVESAVEFLVDASDAARDEVLERARVFCMPSRLPAAGAGEGFGIVLLEAGIHHLPVVAGNVAGALDAVLDGVTGTLVDPLDHVAIADAVCRYLMRPDEGEAVGGAGCERARQMDWNSVSRRVEDLVLRLVDAP